MQLTITTDDDNIVSVHVDAEESLENLKAILEVDTGYPLAEQVLVHNGNELTGATLAAGGVQDGDLIMLARRRPQPQAVSSAAAAGQNALAMNPADGSAVNPQAFLESVLSDPYQLSVLEERNPMLAEIIRSRDVNRLQHVLRESHNARLAAERAEQELLSGDPLDPAVQARIAEAIQRKNIDANLEAAMEHTPEAFASVFMLYVDAEVNGVHLKTFVDSGAQMSIMTAACAEQCSLSRLVDKRYQGMARGVGETKIIGRIHQVPLKVQGQYLPLSVSVLEQKGGPQFILGLDMLKRYQCCIDLEKNELRFSNMGVKLPFLAEHLLPKAQEEGDEADAVQPMDDDAVMQKALQDSMDNKAAASSAAEVAANTGTPIAAPAAAQAAAATATASPAAPAVTTVPAAAPAGQEEKVLRLMGLGFPRQQAVAALEMCGGNEELAASMLFGGL